MQKFPRRTVLKALAAGPTLISVGRSASAAPETGPFEPSKIDLDKARAEGKVILYTSLDTQIVDAIIAAFKKKHGIAVEYFRGGSADVTSKVLAEPDAGRLQADMVDASDLAALLVMKDKGLLKPIKSESTGAVAAELRDPDGTWIADRLTQGVLQYNSNVFGPGKAPQSWKDLTDARMKGRLVFFSSANGDGAPRLYTLAKAFGWELLQALAQTNPLRVQTPQVITQVIERGERGAAFATNDNIALRSKQQGKPRLRFPEGRRSDRARRDRPPEGLGPPARRAAVPRVLDEQGGAGAPFRKRQILEPLGRRVAARQPAIERA